MPGGSAWGVRLGGSACSGVYIWGGSASTGGWADRPQSDTMGYGQRAGGTHPTGMHPCFFFKILPEYFLSTKILISLNREHF